MKNPCRSEVTLEHLATRQISMDRLRERVRVQDLSRYLVRGGPGGKTYVQR
jgi:hypothetical protein